MYVCMFDVCMYVCMYVCMCRATCDEHRHASEGDHSQEHRHFQAAVEIIGKKR